ncbi:hypothetical protein Talka_00142 [Tepidimonas alkaliphilus]|uniref:DUF2818 family protein n=1 Tax=Tepidimonas alkaliphilus TaxID=2588942 RepID=A0A554WD55_9BURK|nr:DUF2818 family protein [Tepidimonas alkaliphilus]TSE21467.1 hypothetical protein Talka_00142 [Tepidimonas alkaliphilus]
MSLQAAVWLVIVLALVGANLPFINQRWLAVLPARGGVKPLWGRLLELALFYFLVGAVALALEAHLGQIYPQRWEFYAVTASMFATLAFPGFVWRYLVRR